MGKWAEQDPESALQASARVATGRVRRGALSHVMNSWAANDPLRLLESVESLPRSMWQDAVGSAVRSGSRTAPGQVAEQLEKLQPMLGTIDLMTEFALVEQWSNIDPIAAMNWIDKNAKELSSRRSRMVQRVVSRYAQVDAEEAMKLALTEKIYADYDKSGPEQYVIDALVNQGKVDTAVGMLDRIRESSMLPSTISIAGSLLVSEQPNKAVRLAQQVPEAERPDFFVNLSLRWMEIDPDELLDQLGSFPSEQIRAEVAQAVLKRSEFSLTP